MLELEQVHLEELLHTYSFHGSLLGCMTDVMFISKLRSVFFNINFSIIFKVLGVSGYQNFDHKSLVHILISLLIVVL